MSIMDAPRARRWPRAQRFSLSSKGAAAEAGYREAIVEARDRPGRDAFDVARAQWAAPLGVKPGDGMHLGELRDGPRTLEELVRALEACNEPKSEVVLALERLETAGLVEALSQPAAPGA